MKENIMQRKCGAKNKQGGQLRKDGKITPEYCAAYAVEGRDRCRIHGGKTPLTNKNAKKHGIYDSVLTDAEKSAWCEMELGKVDDELRLCRIRLLRAMEAEKLANDELELESYSEEPMLVQGVPLADISIRKQQYKRRDYSGIINQLLGRIESLEKTRATLLEQAKDGSTGGLTIKIQRFTEGE